MDDLVANLRLAMADNLNEIDWMGETTKVEARDKLAKFTPKIGYTEKFETYDTMVVGNGAFENSIAAADWAYADMLSQLGQPIDKTEWFMLPQPVNVAMADSPRAIAMNVVGKMRGRVCMPVSVS